MKLDCNPAAGLPGGILNLVQYVGWDHKNIQRLQKKRLSFPEMCGSRAEHNADLIKWMKMLELRVRVRVPGIIVEKIEERIGFPVYPNEVPVLVEYHVLDQHYESPFVRERGFPAERRSVQPCFL